jgi:hypothetical protein
VLTTIGALNKATVSPQLKTGAGTYVDDINEVGIPLDADGDGSERFSMLIRPNLLANAAVGTSSLWLSVSTTQTNRTLVRAERSGEPAGASYRFVDLVAGAKRGLTYRLQFVDLKGKRTWCAAFAIASK